MKICYRKPRILNIYLLIIEMMMLKMVMVIKDGRVYAFMA
jgi:hypothetical protein